MKQPTRAQISQLESELAPLQAEYLGIDLEALTGERDQARAKFRSIPVPSVGYQKPAHKRTDADDYADMLRLAWGDAENALSNAQSRASALEDQMAPLQRMLTAPGRLASAHAEVDALAAVAAASTENIAAAQSPVDRVASLLNAANADHAQAVDVAASHVLAAAKEGRAASAAATDRSKVDAFESALVMAQAELAEAQQSQAAAEQALQVAVKNLRAAESDVARLNLEFALRDVARVVAEYRKASGLDYNAAEDLRRHVYRADAALAREAVRVGR